MTTLATLYVAGMFVLGHIVFACLLWWAWTRFLGWLIEMRVKA